MQAAGAILAACALALLGLAYAWNPAWGAGLSAAMLAELVTGREAAIPLALVAGTPAWLVAATSIAQNLALAAILVPLAMNALRGVDDGGFPGRLLRGLRDSAQQRLPRGRSGWALLGFMLVPFLANGPVVAGLVGAAAGLPARRIAVVVVVAVALTAVAWTYAHSALMDLLSSVDSRLALFPAALAAGLTVAWIVGAVRRAQAPA